MNKVDIYLEEIQADPLQELKIPPAMMKTLKKKVLNIRTQKANVLAGIDKKKEELKKSYAWAKKAKQDTSKFSNFAKNLQQQAKKVEADFKRKESDVIKMMVQHA